MKRTTKSIQTVQKSKNLRSLFYTMLFSFIFVIALVAIPLWMVFKQDYFSKISLQQQLLSDSLQTLSQEVESLTMQIEDLSRPERIEKIAQRACGMQYPVSGDIMVVCAKPAEKPQIVKKESQIITVLRRSFGTWKG